VLEKCTEAAAAAARVEAGRVEILMRYDKAKYRGLNCGGGGYCDMKYGLSTSCTFGVGVRVVVVGIKL